MSFDFLEYRKRFKEIKDTVAVGEDGELYPDPKRLGETIKAMREAIPMLQHGYEITIADYNMLVDNGEDIHAIIEFISEATRFHERVQKRLEELANL